MFREGARFSWRRFYVLHICLVVFVMTDKLTDASFVAVVMAFIGSETIAKFSPAARGNANDGEIPGTEYI